MKALQAETMTTKNAADPRPTRRGLWRWALAPEALPAWSTLVLALLATFAAAWYVRHLQDARAHVQLEAAADELGSRIDRRMLAYEQILHAGAALFAATQEVSRKEWGEFVTHLRLDEHFPGVQGVGFVQVIPAPALAAHERAVRAEGFGDYAVRPAGPRSIYTSIIYLEPFTGRNLRAFGFDMYAEPTRRAAMDLAATSGNAALSGVVRLQQEAERDAQPGFLLYVPVIGEGGAALPGLGEKRLRGWVYAPFRAHDFMHALIGRSQATVEMAVFDGEIIGEAQRLFGFEAVAAASPEFWERRDVIALAGRKWTVWYRPAPAFLAAQGAAQGWVLAAGGAISALLFLVTLVLVTGRQRARGHAARLTRELQQANEELEARVAERTAELSTLMDASPLGIGRLVDRRIVQINRAMARLTGYAPEELLGQTTRLLYFSDEEFETAGRELAAQIGAVGRAELELRCRRKDGAERWFRFFARLIDRAHPERGLAYFAEDITEERSALHALQDSEERTRLLLASTAEAIYGIDLEGHCTFANAACARLLGAEHNLQLLGKQMHELIHHHRSDGSLYPNAECHIYRAFREGRQSHADDEVLFRLDGTSFPAEYWSYPVRRGKELVGAVVTFIDITERRAAETQARERSALIEAQNRELLEAARLKSEFLATMTHELKTPLNAIIGFSELLVEGIPRPLPEDQKAYAQDVLDAGKALLALVEDILLHNRAEAGKLVIDWQPIALPAFLRSRLDEQRAAAAAKGLTLHVQLDPELGAEPLLADPAHLRSLLDELLENALKFTAPGGSITLAASRRGAAEVSVAPSEAALDALKFPGDWAEISVSDTGIGIAAADLPRLFQPFVQLDAGIRRKVGGTGMGLAVARRLAELFGGSLGVTSTPGAGSCFRLLLPWRKTPGPINGG